MNICGIVTEYNPMHLGHQYQLQQARALTSASGIVLVMSGNFVQRGEPAIIDKFSRAKAAVASGVDLVIELPTAFAVSSAEFFADQSMKILHQLGVVTHLNFGSEIGEISPLVEAAKFLVEEPLGYKHLLMEALSEGLAFPSAREKALRAYHHYHNNFDQATLDCLMSPNNILGIEYIKALLKLKSPIIPTTTKRIGAGYHDGDMTLDIPSATAIRKHIKEGHEICELENKMPKASYEALVEAINNQKAPIDQEDLYPFLYHRLLTSKPEDLRSIFDVSEGLEHRFLSLLKPPRDMRTYLDDLKTKRYVHTKLSRALLHIYMQLTKKDLQDWHEHMTPYIRVLAFNSTGQQILREAKLKNEDTIFIVNSKDALKNLSPHQSTCFEMDCKATDLYNLLVFNRYGSAMKNDFTQPVIILNTDKSSPLRSEK